MVQKGANLAKMDQDGPKWAKMSQIGYKNNQLAKADY